MPGDDWQKFANLRLLFSYMYSQPGKKLLFMGGEFGQWSEWAHDRTLEWHLLQYDRHAALRLLIGDLNRLYRTEGALHTFETNPACFEWIEASDGERNVLAYLRKGNSSEPIILVACNFSPVPRDNYRLGVPVKGFWHEMFNSDAKHYGGSGHGNFGGIEAVPFASHGRNYSITLDIPPLGAVFLRQA
jgi:1,4-alpha-glucan branching enzyme